MSLSSATQTLLDEFVGVAPRSGTRIVTLFEPKVYNLSTESEETLRFSDAAYSTGSGHTPASTPWKPRFELPTFRASLGFESGMVGHAGTIRVGSVALINPDGDLDGYLDDSAYSWDGRNAEILIGGHDWDRANFDVLASLKMQPPAADLDTIRISVEGQLLLDRTFASTLYAGFGAAFDFDGSASVIVIGDEYNPGDGSFSIQWRAKWSTSATFRYFIHKRASAQGASDAGYALWLTTGDQVRASIGDGTTAFENSVGAGGAYDDDTWRTFTAVIDRDGDELVTYVDAAEVGTRDDLTGIGTIHSSESLVLGRFSPSGSQYFVGEQDEIRFWAKALSADEVAANYNRALTGSEQSEGLIGLFNFEDYGLIDSGATTLNAVGGPTLYSLVYDASGDEVSWGNVKDVTTGDFAFGCWFKANTSDTSNSWLFGKRNDLSASSAGYGVHINSSGNIAVEVCDGTNASVHRPSTYDFRDGRWYACISVVDRTADTMVTHYKYEGGDWQATGELDISGVTGSLTNAINLKSGRSGNNFNQFLGAATHFVYVPATMTASEAQDAMDSGWYPDDAEPTEPPSITTWKDTGGVGQWPCDEGSGTSVVDAVGSSDGTATAGVTRADRDGDVTKGTGDWVSSLEGNAELAGSPKPICLGRVKDAPCLTVERILERVVQFNTPELSASQEVEAARVDGLIMTGGGTDYTADLTNSVLTVDSAIGDGEVTADVKGLKDSGGTWMYRTGEIADWVVSDQIGATLESGTADALDALYPYEVGLYLKADEYLTREVLAALFQAGREAGGSRGRIFWTELFGGTIRFGALRDISGESPVLSLTSAYIEDSPVGIVKQPMRPPVWKVLVGWQRVWHEFRDFLGGVSEDEQDRMSSRYRWAEKADPGVKDSHAGARVLKLPSLIYREADAKIEAVALFNLFSTPRPVYTVRSVRSMFQVEIGDVVQVTDDRLGLDSGKLFTCIGYSYDLGGSGRYPTAQLELWGAF